MSPSPDSGPSRDPSRDASSGSSGGSSGGSPGRPSSAPAGDGRARRVGPVSVALVVAQFVLIAALASPLATLVPTRPADVPGVVLLLGSFALVAAAFLAMRPANFSVLPEPVEGNRLVQRGPYARVRHPMYTAVLMGGLGACWLHGTALQWGLFGVLVLVMGIKARREEGLLRRVHPDYEAYAERTAALVPGLY